MLQQGTCNDVQFRNSTCISLFCFCIFYYYILGRISHQHLNINFNERWHKLFCIMKVIFFSKHPTNFLCKCLSHLLVVPMQLVVLTVEIPTMHPVKWLCSTPVPKWTRWYSTGVNSQDLPHLAWVLCVWRVGGGVQTPPRCFAGWWQQQCQQCQRQQVERWLVCLLVGYPYSCLHLSN